MWYSRPNQPKHNNKLLKMKRFVIIIASKKKVSID